MEKLNYKQLKINGQCTAEEYYWPVDPDLTDLGDSPTLTESLKRKFPNLKFGKAVLVDGNVVIQDMAVRSSLSNEVLHSLARELNLFSTRTIQIIDPLEATVNLIALIQNNIDLERNIFMFASGSGEDLKKYMIRSTNADLLKYPSALVKVEKRVTEKGFVSCCAQITYADNSQGQDGVIVFDDVVASGLTANQIAIAVKKEFGDIPLCLATWVLVMPDNESGSGVSLYDNVFASYVVKGNLMKRPPINSISRIISDSRVRQDYGKKYFRDIQNYNALLDKLGGDKS